MAVDLEQEDEAEKIAHALRTRRDRFLNNVYWGLLIALGLYAGVHWILGIPYGSWSNWFVLVVIFGVPVMGLLNESGIFDHRAELPYRTKQINERSAQIEKTLNSRGTLE